MLEGRLYERISKEAICPPGDYISEELEARGLDPKGFADTIGIPLNNMLGILQGKGGYSYDTAERIARAFGTSVTIWVLLQGRWLVHQEKMGMRPMIYPRV